MSEPEDELDLQALQRQLDDAFETTRPRTGFEDDLWLRMQSRRPFTSRLSDALAGLVQGIRAVPAVPLASVAAVLVVLIGVGILNLSGLGRGGAANSSAPLALSGGATRSAAGPVGSFGQLPSPVFSPTGVGQGPASSQTAPAPSAASYEGPVALTWTGRLDVSIGTAPVFRYSEPSTDSADQFAASLGAALERRPAGLLGLYTASDYTLTVRGTIQVPAQEPAYFILTASSLPGVSAAGAQPADIAEIFLAEHSLAPQWPYTTTVDGPADQLKVHFQREFDAPGYGPAYLVDGGGNRYGMEVDLNGSRPVLASGPLPLSLDSASYPIITADQAVRAALASAPSPAADAVAPVKVELTSAELVYTLVAAGDHSFYEPAFLFSGSFQVDGVQYVKRVLVPALDPSQRS
ncbi:MAG TPA: hypothetical protein VNF26_14280 [Candidatus Baltobacterales bacterium]|nr:hypothetical protein [Candidatus Baltobacterales bacterium]